MQPTLHNWLAGRRIGITRAADQAAAFAAQVQAYGGVPIICPAIAYAPADSAALDHVFAAIATYDWLCVTSAQAARIVCAAIATSALDGTRIAAVGPATAHALRTAGCNVALVPAEHSAEGLLAAIGDVAGQRILLPAADIARSTLADELRARGATVDTVVAYRTVSGPGAAKLAPLLQAGTVDAVTFTSSSTVRFLIEGLADVAVAAPDAITLLNRCTLVCIGRQTAATADGYGLNIVEAETASTDGLIATLVSQFATADARQ